MLLWLVIALGFAACVVVWHLWQGITWEEAGALCIASAMLFFTLLHVIYHKATTDEYLVSGYVTSLVHHKAYSWQCGKSTCNEPERWIIEQRPHKPQQERKIVYPIHNGNGMEDCQGECNFSYPLPPYPDFVNTKGAYAYAIIVDWQKFIRTSTGDPSAVWRPYFNPVQASDEVVYSDGDNIPYFKLDDYNRAHRLRAPHATDDDEQQLEKINTEFSPRRISVGLVVTSDDLYFEKLKRAWHQGKANDFVVVVNAPDDKTIRNVNVLGWDNYVLKENVAGAIMALPSADVQAMLSAIDRTLHQSQDFSPIDFSKYHFLDVKIPEGYYVQILAFQGLFFIYMLTLLRFNPNTKDTKLSWSEVGRMWDKHFSPPRWNWYLHPLTPSGIILYIIVPLLASGLVT